MPHAFAILNRTGQVQLFARHGKAADIGEHLGDDVTLHDWETFDAAASNLTGTVQIDPKSCPYAIVDLLSGATLIEADDPCALPKACKNPTEIQGTRDAHRRDAVAMVRFLAWLNDCLLYTSPSPRDRG